MKKEKEQLDLEAQMEKKAVAKKYIKVAATLGLISGGAALFIGLTNCLTSPAIEERKQIVLRETLGDIFTTDEEQNFAEVELKQDTTYSYLSDKWEASTSSGALGTIYQASGKNNYGSITMLFGFDTENQFVNMVALENTQTYKTTLETEYIIPVANGEMDISEVSCGATFGARLIYNMYKEAVSDLGGEVVEEDPVQKGLKEVFDEEGETFTPITLTKEYTYVVAKWEASTSSGALGTIYRVKGTNTLPDMEGNIDALIGFTADKQFKKIVLIENNQSFGPDFKTGFVDEVNAGDRDINDISTGTTLSNTLMRDMYNEAAADFGVNVESEEDRENKALPNVFGKENLTYRTMTVTGLNYKYIQKKWTVKEGDAVIGTIYKTNAENEFGNIKLLFGFDTDGEFVKVYTMENTNTFSSNVQSGYLDPINAGEKDFSELLAGATVSTTSIRNMYNECVQDINNPASLSTLFEGGENLTYTRTVVDVNSYKYIKSLWVVTSDTTDDATGEKVSTPVGTIFRTYGTNTYGALGSLIAFDASDGFSKIAIMENTQSEDVQEIISGHVGDINSGKTDITDVNCGATYSASTLKAMYNECVNYLTQESGGQL